MDISPIHAFLGCPTPQEWLECAANPANLWLLLNDHAACELKAAQSAQSLIWRYGAAKVETDEDQICQVANSELKVAQSAQARNGRCAATAVDGSLLDDWQLSLVHRMSRLAREELRHFEQVLALMHQRGIAYVNVAPSRYAGALRKRVGPHEPDKLVDTFIVGAFIEARSCERFAALAPLLEPGLAAFYQSLLKSEARHYLHYLDLAERFASASIEPRVAMFRAWEADLIGSTDRAFRFHSGVPTTDATQSVMQSVIL